MLKWHFFSEGTGSSIDTSTTSAFLLLAALGQQDSTHLVRGLTGGEEFVAFLVVDVFGTDTLKQTAFCRERSMVCCCPFYFYEIGQRRVKIKIYTIPSMYFFIVRE